MKITKDFLKTVYFRGENLEKRTRLDDILNSCLRSAINGFDFHSFGYDENNQEEVSEMIAISEELKKLKLEVYFDGDEGYMKMFVSWY